ncbi:MAG TPA: hypothetical protein VGF55_22650, partial [Gemmataceae bacterium]
MARQLACLVIPAFLTAPAVAAPPPDRVAPAATVELTVAPDLAALEAHWSRTQFAGIYTNPAMQPFFNGAGPELLG